MGIVSSYIAYRGKAKTRHGIHPPFLYRFIDEVLYAQGAERSSDIEALRKAAESNSIAHEVDDFGAGSRAGRSKLVTFGSIARRSASPTALSQLLQRIINYYRYRNVLEFGTNMGFTTAYLVAAQTEPRVVTMEGDLQLSRMAEENLKALDLFADFRVGNFDHIASSALEQLETLDLGFIDGNHQYEPTLRYFRLCLNYLQTHGLLVIGDIHWSLEMEAAWEEIKKEPQVVTTIDIFHAGLVWVNPDLTPEHFTIKFP